MMQRTVRRGPCRRSALSMLRVLFPVLLMILFAVPSQADSSTADRPPMVAAAHPLAAEAGMTVLAAGGSAVDAAIAVQAMLTLVEPQSSGIGGGAFMLHFDAATGRVDAYDGRETAPMAATGDLFLGADGTPLGFFEAVVGGRSVGAPGVLRMLELAHADHGNLPWSQLFQPAIERAAQGFRVTPRLHYLLARDPFLRKQAVAGAYFYPAGLPLPVGFLRTNPDLARTLRVIAANGAEALYSGDIARAIVDTVAGHADNPGLLTMEDLAAYPAKRRTSLCTAFRTYRVCGMPPPTSGGVAVAQILGVLANLPNDPADPLSPAFVHRVTEAERLAYADRALYLADTDFVDVPVADLVRDGYLRRRAGLIDPRQSMGEAVAGDPKGHGWNFRVGRDLKQPSTTHFVIADAAGNVVSMTSSVENAFGSRLMVGGFLLNNQLTDFSFRPVDDDGRPVANAVQPGKRPRSSMSPTIVLNADGSFRAAVGSPGGSRIIGFVAKTLVAMLDGGLDVQTAIALPHYVNRNGPTELEQGAALDDLARALEARGHDIRVRGLNSGLHGIERVTQAGKAIWRGGADPRREGVVLTLPR